MLAEAPINVVVKQVAEATRRVLLADTCVLLDIIRDPLRNGIQSLCAARDLDAAAEAGSLSVVLASTVVNEWDQRADSITAELEKWIRTVQRQNNILLQAHRVVDPLTPNGQVDYVSMKTASMLRAKAQALVDNALVLAPDDECLLRAAHRNRSYQAPAAKGESGKDCDIIEHYFDFCRKLRHKGFVQTCVFASSNRQDFCGYKGSSALHPKLQAEFSTMDLAFAASLPAARGLLL